MRNRIALVATTAAFALSGTACASDTASTETSAKASTEMAAADTAPAPEQAAETAPAPEAAAPADTAPPAATEPAPPSTAPADAPAMKPATQADVKVGAAIMDSKGEALGTVASVDADGVVIAAGTVRAKVPLASVGVSDKGLMITITKAEFDAAAKKGS